MFGLSKDDSSMSFLDHIEALRWHIVRSVVVIAVFSLTLFLFPEIVFDKIILGPKNLDFITYRAFCSLSHWAGLGDALCMTIDFTLTNIAMSGQFMMHLQVSLILGFILAFPYVLWEIWSFIKPALYEKEMKYTRGVVFFSSILFLTGVLFSYFLVTPLSVNFLGNYKVSPEIQNTITLESYIDMLVMLSLGCGIVFELPIVVYFLSKIGIVTPQGMRQYRKHAIIVILLVSAIITPSPDMMSQSLVAVPLYFLYEVSIFISARYSKKDN